MHVYPTQNKQKYDCANRQNYTNREILRMNRPHISTQNLSLPKLVCARAPWCLCLCIWISEKRSMVLLDLRLIDNTYVKPIIKLLNVIFVASLTWADLFLLFLSFIWPNEANEFYSILQINEIHFVACNKKNKYFVLKRWISFQLVFL